jgi:hypothetical protein
MTHFFRKESFRVDWRIQAQNAQHVMKLDVRSLELERRAEADGNTHVIFPNLYSASSSDSA